MKSAKRTIDARDQQERALQFARFSQDQLRRLAGEDAKPPTKRVLALADKPEEPKGKKEKREKQRARREKPKKDDGDDVE